MGNPYETITVQCMQCRRKFDVSAARRRRSIRLGQQTADFCSQTCNRLYVAQQGTKAQIDQITKPK